jgi:hypothetical protein
MYEVEKVEQFGEEIVMDLKLPTKRTYKTLVDKKGLGGI